MAIRIRAIRAKRPVVGVNRNRVLREMLQTGVGFTSEVSRYPTQRSHIRYRRTGRLGQGWTTIWPHFEGDKLITGTGNKIAYAGPVQGFKRRRPRQRDWAQSYGWPNVEDIGKGVWKRHRPRVLAALQGRR